MAWLRSDATLWVMSVSHREPEPPPPPRWTSPGGKRKRVLVETPRPAVGWALHRILTDEGYEVVVCGGPASRGGDCPLLRGAICPAAEGATAILYSLSLHDPRDRDVLAAHAITHPDVPVLIEIPPVLERSLAELVAEQGTVDSTASREELVDAVRKIIS